MKTKTIDTRKNLKVPRSLHNRLKVEVDRQGIYMKHVIREAIEDWIKKSQGKNN